MAEATRAAPPWVQAHIRDRLQLLPRQPQVQAPPSPQRVQKNMQPQLQLQAVCQRCAWRSADAGSQSSQAVASAPGALILRAFPKIRPALAQAQARELVHRI